MDKGRLINIHTDEPILMSTKCKFYLTYISILGISTLDKRDYYPYTKTITGLKAKNGFHAINLILQRSYRYIT